MSPPVPPETERVRLRDGAEVLIRAVRPEDRPLFAAGFAQLSDESRYQRFLGTKSALSPGELDVFTRPDHADHEALGAQDPATGAGLGVARYFRLPAAPTVAEAAVVVIDAWQGRGLGTALLERLAARAAAAGIEEFVATLSTTNETMLRLFERLGATTLRRDGPVLEIEVRLAVRGAALGEALRAVARGDVRGVAPEERV